MKLKHWIGLIGIAAGLALAADFTTSKTYTVTGPSFPANALYVYAAKSGDVPVEIRVRIQDPLNPYSDIWTTNRIAALPDTITVGGKAVSNEFKTGMRAAFEKGHVVTAYKWSLQPGYEAAMVPIVPDPDAAAEPTP